MTPEQQEPMEIDSAEQCRGSSKGLKDNGLNLFPVSVNDSGEGLPYAPENWPKPGDKWRWKVGKRIANSGHFLDRYVYPPKRLRKTGQSNYFPSKLSLENFIRANFPDADVKAIFASFSWKIPSTSVQEEDDKVIFRRHRDISENRESEGVRCKAGNRLCSSLSEVMNSVSSEVMFCDICCNEPGFCRDCCCILCCKSINHKDEYGHIRCEANIDGQMCGHICHMDCALRSYMAGTVGGSIGLDAEYYCRRCDSRTDLVSYATKILQKCELVDSRDDVEKALRVSFLVLQGSKKESAEELLRRIELAMLKLKNGTNLEDIWKGVQNSVVIPVHAGQSLIAVHSPESDKEIQDTEMGLPQTPSTNFDNGVESLKLGTKIDQILHGLKESQEIEYKIAEEKLFAQKNYILNLYEQLEKERSDVSMRTSAKEKSSLLDVVLNRAQQINREVLRLKEMEGVAMGFGKVSKQILSEQFGVDVDN